MHAVVWGNRRYTGSPDSLVHQLLMAGHADADAYVAEHARVAPNLGLKELYEGTVGVLKSSFFPAGVTTVRARAAVCRSCSWRFDAPGECMTCRASSALASVAEAALRMASNRDTVGAPDLANSGCGYCGCALEPLLRSDPRDVVDKQNRPPECWIVKETQI